MDNKNNRTGGTLNLYKLIGATTRKWVADNYGQSEADDPSWDIEELSATIAGAIMDKVEESKK